MSKVYLALGSNLGDCKNYLKQAINRLVIHREIKLVEMSSLYETEPVSEIEQKKIQPIYESHKGWLENTQGARSWSDLPALAIKYVRRIEELLETQVSLLSTSPRREDTISVKNPFIG